MRAVEYKKPLLQSGHCLISDYDRQWIENVLKEAAKEAGVRIPMVSEVASGILQYLERKCPLGILPLEYFFSRVRGLLREIGLPRIADHLHLQMPPVHIELDAMADEDSLPLFFYTKLRRHIDELRELGMTSYRFSGIRRCSLVLGERRRSCPTQQRVLQELKSFIAMQAA